MTKRASPTPIRSMEEQLRSLHRRRSVIDRLIHALEMYQRATPAAKNTRTKQVA